MSHRVKYTGEGFARGPLPVMAAWALGGLLFHVIAPALARAAQRVDGGMADFGGDD